MFVRPDLSVLSPPVKGALYMVAYAVALSVMVVLVRLATEEVHAFEIGFFRNLFGLLFLLPWLFSNGVVASLRTRNLRWHALRGATGVIAMLTWYLALAMIPMAEAVSLNFTVPLFATIGAALLLRESVRARRWIAIAIGICGVLLIVRPGVETVSMGAVVTLVSAFFSALSALLVKRLSGTEAPGTIAAYMTLFAIPIALLAALPVWTWPSVEALALLLGVGACGTVGHVCFARAMAQADASAMMPYEYLRLPLVALFGWSLFGETMDLLSWLGAGVIVASTLYIIQREAALARARREQAKLAAWRADQEKL